MTNKTEGQSGYQLGYARTGPGSQALETQLDALANAGVARNRIYSDHATDQRPGWAALLDYARPGDTAVVAGIDRLGRTVPEVLDSARELAARDIGVRSLREGIDTRDAAGSMIVGVLASLGDLEIQTPRARRRAVSDHLHPLVGRPRALDDQQITTAHQMRSAGHPVPDIAAALGVSRATVYRVLAESEMTR